MAKITTRDSVLAVTVESSEGTPVAPSAGTEFTALQDDADMSPEFETLENAELKASLGSAKPIQGFENPTFSFSHYLRHSGTEGVAPDYNELLKGVYGTETVNSTEYDTVGGSTASTVVVDAGEGVNFSRGQMLLVKDLTNGYSVRPVDSISTDTLNLGFNVSTAPGSGVNLGKCVQYSPADSGHQSMSVWHYLGNGGATQMISGAKATEFSMTAEAGQIINASYSLEGLKYFFNPIEILAADIYIDFTDDQGTVAATVAAKMYRDPHELADAIASAMNAVTTETIECTYSDTTGQFTIGSSTSAVLSLLWQSGTNTANTIGDKIGFSVVADDTGSTEYVGDSPISFAAEYTPSFDAADPLVAKYHQILLGDADNLVCFPATSISHTVSDTRRPIESICAETGRSGSLINERAVTSTVTALLDKFDADKFRKFRSNADVKFLYVMGNKDGAANWVPGTVTAIYQPTAVISSFDLSDDDGLVALEVEITSYVNDSGDGEAYLGML